MNNLCEVCDDRPATIHCTVCLKNKLYCEECFKVSHNTNSKKSHKSEKYVPSTQDQNVFPSVAFCSKHPKEEKKYCCMACNASVCGDCIALGNHKGHEVSTIQKGFEKESKEIKSSLEAYEKNFKLRIELKEHISAFLSNISWLLHK